MIKNDKQLKRAQKRLDEINHQIEEYQRQFSGIERELLVIPLIDEEEELEKEIKEYHELRQMSFEDVVQGPLSRPTLIDNIGLLLAKLRIAAKLTQEDLAKQLDWEQSNLSRFESENYSSQTIGKIVEFASALGVWLYITPSLTEQPLDVKFTKTKFTQSKIETASTSSEVLTVSGEDNLTTAFSKPAHYRKGLEPETV